MATPGPNIAISSAHALNPGKRRREGATTDSRQGMAEKGPVISASSLAEASLKPEAIEPSAQSGPAAAPAGSAPASSAGAPALNRAEVEALIAKEYAGLRLLIFRRARDLNVAADLLNDAVCTTWEKWLTGQIARPEQIAGYVFQVAMNLLRNHRRAMAERPEKRAELRALDELPMDEPDTQGVEDGLARRVKRLLQGMSSQRDRTVLVRFYLNEEDREVICRDMKLTPAQFARVIHRARGRLRQLMEAEGLKGSDLYSLLVAM
jgi:RNA polymerase sigma-70 factor (ECF subfamily)